VRLKAIAEGKTYSQISAAAQANPQDPKLAGQMQTLFRCETLRGRLLDVWGIHALYPAIGLTVAALAVFLALVFELVAMTQSAEATRADRAARELATVEPAPKASIPMSPGSGPARPLEPANRLHSELALLWLRSLIWRRHLETACHRLDRDHDRPHESDWLGAAVREIVAHEVRLNTSPHVHYASRLLGVR
jgi:hypothetical protein